MKCHHCQSKVNNAFLFDDWYHCKKCNKDFGILDGVLISREEANLLACGCPSCERKREDLKNGPSPKD